MSESEAEVSQKPKSWVSRIFDGVEIFLTAVLFVGTFASAISQGLHPLIALPVAIIVTVIGLMVYG